MSAANHDKLDQHEGKRPVQHMVRTLRWRVDELVLAVILALMLAPWCWQFSAGIAFSQIIGTLDFWLGRRDAQSPNA